MKRPSFQFYPGDWLHDTALRACSLDARGLWADMICYMHQGTPYGHLTLPAVSEDGGKDILRPILPPVLARMVGSTSENVERLLAELEHAGVFSRTTEGVIFSRRMVQDEKLREIRASGGIQSLKHPNVPHPKDRRKDTLEESSSVCSRESPSSSSSSSKNITSEPCGSDSASTRRKKSSLPPTAEGRQLAQILRGHILRNNPSARVTEGQVQKWALEADRMVCLDGRTPAQIAELIDFSQNDNFWFANILSMGKLRGQFDQLTNQRKRKQQTLTDSHGAESPEESPSRPKWVGLTDDNGRDRGER